MRIQIAKDLCKIPMRLHITLCRLRLAHCKLNTKNNKAPEPGTKRRSHNRPKSTTPNPTKPCTWACHPILIQCTYKFPRSFIRSFTRHFNFIMYTAIHCVYKPKVAIERCRVKIKSNLILFNIIPLKSTSEMSQSR